MFPLPPSPSPRSLARARLDRRCELGRLRTRLAEIERAQHSRDRTPDRSRACAVGGSETAAGRERCRPETLSTGFPELDEALDGGFRVGALNELLIQPAGSGAAGAASSARSIHATGGRGLLGAGSGVLEAFLPALARMQARWLAWIQPARLARRPYPPALVQAGIDLSRLLLVQPADAREQAWALDLVLRSGACDTAVSRLSGSEVWLEDRSLRRLELAAEEGGTLGLLVRPAGGARAPSPAAVRLEVAPLLSPDPRRRRLQVQVLRCRGSSSFPIEPLVLEWSRDPLDEPAAPAAAARPSAAAAIRPALALGA